MTAGVSIAEQAMRRGELVSRQVRAERLGGAVRFDASAKRIARKADIFVGSINHALRGIPEEMVRFHTCYGINHGPRVFEPQLAQAAP